LSDTNPLDIERDVDKKKTHLKGWKQESQVKAN